MPKDDPKKPAKIPPKDKLPDNQIGDEDPIPIFPMDDNPGEIKADDLEKVRQIYKNATILADPIACKKGNQNLSNDVESKGKLLKDKKNNKNKSNDIESKGKFNDNNKSNDIESKGKFTDKNKSNETITRYINTKEIFIPVCLFKTV